MIWRSDIDALAFPANGNAASCVVHRRAFRTLMGAEPSPAACEAFFRANRAAFEAAASAKIREKRVARALNFHLTSRDVARQLGSSSAGRPAKIGV